MKKTLLVIDDDEAIRDSIKMVFEDEGFEVETSPDGSPIDNFNGSKPDVVILDIMLEKEDGRGLAQKIKSQKLPKPKGLIIISALPNEEQSAFDAGADYYCSKPFDVALLLHRVKELAARG